MDCHPGADPLVFDAAEYATHLPGDRRVVALCPRCLALVPADGPPAADPDFSRVSGAFPPDPDAARAFAVLLGLLDSLALYREELTALLEAVERGGADPLLALDRLAGDPAVETDLDLAGRRRQLAQLL